MRRPTAHAAEPVWDIRASGCRRTRVIHYTQHPAHRFFAGNTPPDMKVRGQVGGNTHSSGAVRVGTLVRRYRQGRAAILRASINVLRPHFIVFWWLCQRDLLAARVRAQRLIQHRSFFPICGSHEH